MVQIDKLSLQQTVRTVQMYRTTKTLLKNTFPLLVVFWWIRVWHGTTERISWQGSAGTTNNEGHYNNIKNACIFC